MGAGALVVAGLVVRWHFRGVQSYWSDELFSVEQARRPSLRGVLYEGLREVHTPLFAVLLHGWTRLGGSAPTAWMRLFPVLLGVASVVVAHLLLRRLPISREARWLAVAATSAGGFLVVYAQEVRPYALVALGAVGVTAQSLRRWLTVDAGRRGLLAWTAWALLAATSHLLGAVLVAVLAGLLAARSVTHPAAPATAPAAVGRRAREVVELLAGAALALVPQAAWIVVGSRRAGFADGTGWIKAATPKDVAALLTSTFSAGDLSPRPDGFAWTAPWGLVVVAGLLLAAVATRASSRAPDDGPGPAEPAGPTEPAEATRDLEAARFLLGVALGTGVVTYGLAQIEHVWTLRNLIVIVPALLWGTACGLTGLPRDRRGRRVITWAALAGLTASLAATTGDISQPYKPDFRAAMRYLVSVRAADPGATFVFLAAEVPRRQLLAADLPATDAPTVRHLFDRTATLPRADASVTRLHRLPGAEVVVYYRDITGRRDAGARAAILARLGPGCAPVPVHAVVVVTCPAPHP